MEAMVTRLMNGENVEVMETPGFTNFDDAKSFMIECGKAARKIATENEDSFFCKNAMREVENAWYEALHADCSYAVHTAACHAFGWLKKMHDMFNA